MKKMALALAIFVGLPGAFLQPALSGSSLVTPPVIEEPEPVAPRPWPPVDEPEPVPPLP